MRRQQEKGSVIHAALFFRSPTESIQTRAPHDPAISPSGHLAPWQTRRAVPPPRHGFTDMRGAPLEPQA